MKLKKTTNLFLSPDKYIIENENVVIIIPTWRNLIKLLLRLKKIYFFLISSADAISKILEQFFRFALHLT